MSEKPILEPMPTNSIDTEKYNGTKTKIADWAVEKDKSDYNEKGEYVMGLQRDVDVIYVTTESIGETGTGAPIVIREKFNLLTNPKTGNLAWSTHPKSNVTKLFAKFRVSSFDDLIGKECLIVEKVSAKNPDRKWLGIQY